MMKPNNPPNVLEDCYYISLGKKKPPFSQKVMLHFDFLVVERKSRGFIFKKTVLLTENLEPRLPPHDFLQVAKL